MTLRQRSDGLARLRVDCAYREPGKGFSLDASCLKMKKSKAPAASGSSIMSFFNKKAPGVDISSKDLVVLSASTPSAKEQSSISIVSGADSATKS